MSLLIVAGYPGAGKSTVSHLLATETGAALLDKDTLAAGFADRLNAALGLPSHDRDSETYNKEVRPLEYQALYDAIGDNLLTGNNVIATAPWLAEFTVPTWREYLRFCDIGGYPQEHLQEVLLCWVRCDADTRRRRITERGQARDECKLSHWDDYVAGLPDEVAYIEAADVVIDNPEGQDQSLHDQVCALADRMTDLEGVQKI